MKELNLLVEQYREKLLQYVEREEEREAVLALSPGEILLLLHENLNIERMIDGYLVDRLMRGKDVVL